jgi:hypothetical protein
MDAPRAGSLTNKKLGNQIRAQQEEDTHPECSRFKNQRTGVKQLPLHAGNTRKQGSAPCMSNKYTEERKKAKDVEFGPIKAGFYVGLIFRSAR